MEELLTDVSPSGRLRPWNEHKNGNKKIIDVLRYMEDETKARRIENCANVLEFSECPNNHGKWLKRAFFCKDRVCRLCAWRKSLFVYHQVLQVTHEIIRIMPGCQVLFFTATVKNCAPEKLSDGITLVNQGWFRFINFKEIKKAFKGWFRGTEVTYNPITNTMHPHIHGLGIVNGNYFKNPEYLSQARLTEFWQVAARLDYKPVVHIEKARPKHPGINTVCEDIQEMDLALAGAAGEAAKYAVKVQDFIDPVFKNSDSPEIIQAKKRLKGDIRLQATVLENLIGGIKHRRLNSYSGVYKEAYQRLNCQDVEKSDLILMPGEETICQCKICQSELIQMHYHFNGKNYVKGEKNYVTKNKI